MDTMSVSLPTEQTPSPAPHSRRAPDRFVAFGCLIAGYFLCRLSALSAHPFGAALLLGLLAIAVTLLLLLDRDRPTGGVSNRRILLRGGILLLIAWTLPLQSAAFVQILAEMLYFAGLLYLPASGYGLLLEKSPGKYFFSDCLRLIPLPFLRPDAIYPAAFGGRHRKRSSGKVGRSAVQLLLGLLLALIPTVTVVLLLGYDPRFSELLKHLFTGWELPDLEPWIWAAIFGLPVAMLLYSVYHAASRQWGAERHSAERAAQRKKRRQFLPTPITAGVYLPLLLVYALFFFSQWETYLAAFGGGLPDGFSYAAYARDGFFNLLAVAAINATVILLLQLFTRKKEDGETSASEKLGILLLSLSTLLLLATAAAKLVLYISAYGLTVKRLYAGWCMALLAVAFLLVILRQFLRRFPLTPALLSCALGFFAVLSLYDWKGFIAERNVDRYLQGELQMVDTELLQDLGDSGVPALCRLLQADHLDDTVRKCALITLRSTAAWENRTGVFSRTLPYCKARSTIREYKDRITAQMEKDPLLRFPGWEIEIGEEGILEISCTVKLDDFYLSTESCSLANGRPFRVGDTAQFSFETALQALPFHSLAYSADSKLQFDWSLYSENGETHILRESIYTLGSLPAEWLQGKLILSPGDRYTVERK